MVNYKYDALCRRIQRTTSAGANERYVYDGANVLLDLNADWSVATTYLNGLGIDNHLRQTSAATGIAYFLTDHLGSTTGLTNSTGNVIEQTGTTRLAIVPAAHARATLTPVANAMPIRA